MVKWLVQGYMDDDDDGLASSLGCPTPELMCRPPALYCFPHSSVPGT